MYISHMYIIDIVKMQAVNLQMEPNNPGVLLLFFKWKGRKKWRLIQRTKIFHENSYGHEYNIHFQQFVFKLLTCMKHLSDKNGTFSGRMRCINAR